MCQCRSRVLLEGEKKDSRIGDAKHRVSSLEYTVLDQG